jgi:hypothetical protein
MFNQPHAKPIPDRGAGGAPGEGSKGPCTMPEFERGASPRAPKGTGAVERLEGNRASARLPQCTSGGELRHERQYRV